MYEVLHEEDEEEVEASGGVEHTDSPKKQSFGEKVVRARRESSSAAPFSPRSVPSPIRRIGDLKSSSASRPPSIVSPVRTAGESNRPLSITSFSQLLGDSNRRKSVPTLSVEGGQDHRTSLSAPAIKDGQSRGPSIPYHPADERQDRRMSAPSLLVDESEIYNRGVKVEAKICKVHFTAWRRKLHRGCEDKTCLLFHDPRGWPARIVDMVPSGPMKELLEIQQDIDVVLGRGEFDMDAALAKLKPPIALPPRSRQRRDENKNKMPETEELSPVELAEKGRRIQEIWDEALRLYRLRKENPAAVVAPATRKHAQVEDRPQALSFF